MAMSSRTRRRAVGYHPSASFGAERRISLRDPFRQGWNLRFARRGGLGMRAIGCEPAFSLVSGRWLTVRGGSIAVEVLQGGHLECMLVKRAVAGSRSEVGRRSGMERR